MQSHIPAPIRKKIIEMFCFVLRLHLESAFENTWGPVWGLDLHYPYTAMHKSEGCDQGRELELGLSLMWSGKSCPAEFP